MKARAAASLFLFALMLGCPSTDTPIGLVEGDYFRYDSQSGTSSRVQFYNEYRVSSVSGNRIKVTRTKIQMIDGQETRRDTRLTYTIDTGGIIRDTSAPADAAFKGLDLKRQFQLWLPPSKRVPGAFVQFAGTLGKYKIQEPGQFKQWDVWTAGYHDERLHFDRNTGWLVGGVRGGRPVELVGSNRDLL